ncbi:MAG: diacylglycerol kinase family lipid kinase [Anaerolineae bacterium]|nr:diacylglycerol kinase family lipid kinase [Anaerolineae bacterium]
MARYKVIVNPTAGKGVAGASIPILEQKLNESGMAYELVKTERPWHAAELARQAIRSGFEVAVAVGGDGTVNEIINGIVAAQEAGEGNISLGIIPIGTGNDFAYGVGILPGLNSNIATLTNLQKRWVDIGWFSGNQSINRFFGNGIGVGFDAMVNIVASRMKRLRGFLSYIVAVLRTILLDYRSPKTEIIYDDQMLAQRCVMISIMNGRRMGGGFHMTPTSLPDDGLLDTCIAGYVDRLSILALLPRFIKGNQKGHPAIQFQQAHAVHVRILEGTLPVHLDGEAMGTDFKEVEVKILPRKLEVITSPHPA